MLLCESVATRLRDHQRLCKTVQVYFRDCKLESFDRQQRFPEPTQLARELHAAAMSLYRRYRPQNPLRSIGVRACDLIPQDEGLQLSMIPEERKRQEWMALEHTMDDIRFRFGHDAISRGVMMTDILGKGSPKDDHIFTFPAHSL
jgi:DNA polymerase-4